MEGHWSCTCHTPKHLVDLYQASIKGKGKGIETNFVNHNDPEDPMNYLDFFKWSGYDLSWCVIDGKFDDNLSWCFIDGNVHVVHVLKVN